MGGRYLTDMADVLRGAGLHVIEQDGWKTRARSSGGFDGNRPWCVMWHHAASAIGATAKQVADYGSYNADTKPVQNIVLGRVGNTWRDIEVWVCAAGATNTNGKGLATALSRGTVPADQMNTHAIGIEAVNNGVGEPWPGPQIDAYFVLNNALCSAYGLLPTDCVSHAAYAPDRKIDPATAAAVQGVWRPRATNTSGTWDLADIRSEAVARSAPPPSKEGLMYSILSCEGNKFGGMMDAHGICNPITWLTPERYETCLRLGAPEVIVNRGDLAGCDLLGAMPSGFTRENFANVIP